MTEAFAVAVVGGGVTGACAAALLARSAGIPASRIALLAAQLPATQAPGAAPELRVTALSRASERVLRAAGAWERLDATRLCAFERMHVWHESAAVHSAAALNFDAADIGEPNLGYIAENGALQRACIESFLDAGGRLVHAPLEQLVFGEDSARLQCAGEVFTAQLVVGADGVHSVVREGAGLSVRTRDYHQVALVATVATQKPHANTAWQRFLHTGPLAFLPLFNGQSSIVWSLDLGAAEGLDDCDEDEFNARLDLASALALGATRVVSKRVSFPLSSVSADSYIAERCALIGDAAHVIHPLAGQGGNLGLLDAAALCEAIATAPPRREDPGALRVLRGYEQQRRTHNLAVDAVMSAFKTGFAGARGPAAWLLNRALTTVNRSSVLKQAFARHALGTTGELPSLARAVG